MQSTELRTLRTHCSHIARATTLMVHVFMASYGGRMGMTLLEPHAQELVYQLGGKKVWSLVRAVGA